MGRRPNTFIVGAPKSGTTSLYEYLEDHPDIYMSPVKEPAFFSTDVVGGKRKRDAYGDLDQYLGLFAKARDEKRVGEASAVYLMSEQAPRLIHAFEPSARIIVMLRNPVDVLYSLHNERVSSRIEEISDFEEAMAADAARRAGRRLRPGANSAWSVYRNLVQFGQQLERWFDVFDRAQVHTIVFDDFAHDTAGEFRRTLEFLGVEPDYQPASFATRRASHRTRGGPISALVRNPVAKWVAHKAVPAVLGQGSASRLVWQFRQSRLNRKPHARPELKPELRLALEEELTPDVQRLSELVGRDLVGLWFGRQAAVALATDHARAHG